MAQTKKTTTTKQTPTRSRKRKTTAKKQQKSFQDYLKLFLQRVIKLLKDPRTPRILGLFCWLFALFLLIAFISYIFNWGPDQSQVRDASWWGFLFDSSVHTKNALGRLGSLLSHKFIYNWFGLASFTVIGTLVFTGLRLIFARFKFPLGPIYQNTFGILVLSSIILGYLTAGNVSGFPYGGGFGNYVSNWLISFIGFSGTGLFLFFSVIAILVWVFDLQMDIIGWLQHQWSTDEEKASVRTKTTAKPEKTAPSLWEKLRALFASAAPHPIPQKALPKQRKTAKNKKVETDFGRPAPTTNHSNRNGQLNGQTQNGTTDVEQTELEQIELDFEQQLRKKKRRRKKDAAPTDEEILLDIAPPAAEKEATAIEEEPTDGDLAIGKKEYDPTADLSNYILPHIDLLEKYGHDLYDDDVIQISRDELERNKEQIVETLSNYNIEISKIRATPGPTVTLYEIVPAPGVRISKIRNLEDDIALSLAALGIRIIAPMPGKGTIGIEVPNQTKDIVSLRGLIASEKFQNTKMDLPVALGRTISNEPFIADLAKMPHLLMAGATGQGKSVCLNSILASLLYKKHPAELKMVMIDPKKVELSLFNMIEKHYLCKLPGEEEAIVTDTAKVINTLNALCIEMDLRYDLLKRAYVRNIKEYNRKFIKRKLNPEKGHRYLPFLVLVIDEFADLIMTAGKEVEMPIARLAQLARAVGIHLIIATQRPSVNIITGTIKANFPVRVAFRVSSKIDSRTILDAGGANQLIGRGDMLISIGPEVIRLQGAFIDTPEVERLTEFISQQPSYPEAFLLPEYSDDDNDLGNPAHVDFDDLFEDAAHIIVQHQQGSTSLLQRRLKLGYNRAGRIMDQLEITGIVGPNIGSKARDVYVHDEFELNMLLDGLKQK